MCFILQVLKHMDERMKEGLGRRWWEDGELGGGKVPSPTALTWGLRFRGGWLVGSAGNRAGCEAFGP